MSYLKAADMRIIETRTYGYLDYCIAIVLLVMPAVLGHNVKLAQIIIPPALGLLTIFFNLITAYEISITNIIPMKTRLKFDFFAGVFLAGTPWIFGFAAVMFMPYLIIGIIIVLVSLLSKTKPQVRLTIWR